MSNTSEVGDVRPVLQSPAMNVSTSRREFIVATTASLLIPRTARARQSTVTVQQVIERIRSQVGVDWRPQTNDGLKSGDLSTIVSGIAVTVMASTDVLRRAAAAGQNLIITQEPIFYSANDDPGNRAKDPVYQTKKNFIDDRHLAVFRFAEHWNARQPNESAKALAGALKWTTEVADAPQTYRIAETTLEGLATQLRNQLPMRGGLRMVGQGGMRVRTVCLAPGTTSLAAAVSNLQRADVLLSGEPREWEAVPYILDTWSAGSGKGLIAIGRTISEGPGMQVCAAWIRSLVPELRVDFIAGDDPYWSING